jgi:hypothetical protein
MKYELKVKSWAERFRGSQCAEHYYGYLYDGGIRVVDLEHKIYLTDPRYADCSLACMRAKPGETRMSCRFAEREEIVVAARKWMAENAKPNDILVLPEWAK